MDICDYFRVKTVNKQVSEYNLLSQKYAPKQLSEFLDNYSQIKKFEDWIKNRQKKCFIITGEVGSGKSSLALLMCKHFNLNHLFLDASCKRSKKEMSSLHEKIRHINNKLIILDEMESIVSSSETFGLSTLSKWIDPKNDQSKVSFIIIIQKIFLNKLSDIISLADVIHLNYPSSRSIFSKCLSIIDDEHIDIELDELKTYIANYNGDIRSILNNLREFKIISKIDKNIDIYEAFNRIKTSDDVSSSLNYFNCI